MADITVPEPALVVMIGAAGSGKSTFAARHFAASEVVSSDALRAVIAGDQSDQRRNAAVFRRLHGDIERRLSSAMMTVVDATNAERGARVALVSRARAAGIAAIAIVLDLPVVVVLARNAGRREAGGRAVDPAIVRRHLDRIASLEGERGLTAEGFAAAWIIRSAAELDAVRIVREPAISPPRVQPP